MQSCDPASLAVRLAIASLPNGYLSSPLSLFPFLFLFHQLLLLLSSFLVITHQSLAPPPTALFNHHLSQTTVVFVFVFSPHFFTTPPLIMVKNPVMAAECEKYVKNFDLVLPSWYEEVPDIETRFQPSMATRRRDAFLLHENLTHLKHYRDTKTGADYIILYRPRLQKAKAPRCLKKIKALFDGYEQVKLLGGKQKAAVSLQPFFNYLPKFLDCGDARTTKANRETFSSKFVLLQLQPQGVIKKSASPRQQKRISSQTPEPQSGSDTEMDSSMSPCSGEWGEEPSYECHGAGIPDCGFYDAELQSPTEDNLGSLSLYSPSPSPCSYSEDEGGFHLEEPIPWYCAVPHQEADLFE